MNDELEFEVFISFKNTNENNELKLAEDIYNKLKEKGLKCFFSKRTIIDYGKSDYSKIINSALDTARVLIVTASSFKNITSKYVEYEWNSFLNEILSGRKKDGEIFVVLNGMTVDELPYPLRSTQHFFASDIDSLIESICNTFTLGIIEEKHYEALDIKDFNNRNIKHPENVNEPIRKNLMQFVSNFLISDNRSCFLYGEVGIGITQFFESFVTKFKNTATIIYSLDYSQLTEFIDTTKIDLRTIKYIFIDSISKGEDIEKIMTLLMHYPNLKLVASISLSLVNDLYKYINSKVPFTTYSVPYLSSEEIYQFFNNYFSSEEKINRSTVLKDFIINTPTNYFKKPSIILMLIKALKVGKIDLDNFSIIDVFELIEENDGLDKIEDEVINIIYESKNIYVSKKDVESSSIMALVEKGIMQLSNGRYEFKDNEYFKYKLAKYISNNHEKIFKLADFPKEFLICLPYYVAINYFENLNLKKFDFYGVSPALIYDIFDILIVSEKSILKLTGNNELTKYLLDYVSLKSEYGYYSLAELIINTLDKFNVCNKQDLDAERFILSYYKKGQIDLQTNNSGRYFYYLSLTYYLMDDYNKALRYIKKALNSRDITRQLYINICLCYIDLLVDFGNEKKASKVIKKIENEELSMDQRCHIYNVKGFFKRCEGKFVDAVRIYEEAIELLKNDKQNNLLAFLYGNSAIVYMYLGEYDKAIESITRNIEICESNSNYNGLAGSNDIYAQILFLQQNYLESYKTLSNALIYAKKSQNRWREFRIELEINIISVFLNRPAFDMIELKKNIDSLDLDEYWPYSYMLLALAYNYFDKDKAKEILNITKKYIKNSNEIESRNLFETVYQYIFKDEYVAKSTFAKNYLSSYKQLYKLDIEKFKNFVPFKEFELGDILLVKPLSIYSEDIFDYASDFDTTRFMTWNAHKSIFDSLSFLENCLQKEKEGNYLAWVIKHEDKAIGMIDMNFNSEYNCYEIGFILSKKYWRQGIMFMVSSTIIDYFFSMKQDKIVGIVYEGDKASICLLNKLGFVSVAMRVNEDDAAKIVLVCSKKQ